jgi:glycosyltransferase involved in cell wall biosynthesis
MNLLMVGLDLNPPWAEGIRNTTHELAFELLNRGHRVCFLTKGYNYHKKIETMKGGITFHRILTKEHSGYLRGFQRFLLKLPSAILEIAKEYGVDAIHVHSSYPAFGWYVGISAALVDSKKIFSLYSCSTAQVAFEYSSPLRLALRLAKSYKPLRLKAVDEIIVNSKKAYNHLIGIGLRKNLYYIPIGIDTSRFKPEKINGTCIKEKLKIPKEAKVILFAGDLTPYKGVELFLTSLKKLKDSGKNVVGLILTKGLYEQELHRRQLVKNLITKFNLTDNIRLLGIRSDIEIVYNLSDIVVFPFLRGYALMDIPRAVLEAMACGRPVVATKVGAISEAIRHGENGILIEPNNELALKNAIALLLQNEEEADLLGKNATSFVLENHELGTMVSKVEEVYNRL